MRSVYPFQPLLLHCYYHYCSHYSYCYRDYYSPPLNFHFFLLLSSLLLLYYHYDQGSSPSCSGSCCHHHHYYHCCWWTTQCWHNVQRASIPLTSFVLPQLCWPPLPIFSWLHSASISSSQYALPSYSSARDASKTRRLYFEVCIIIMWESKVVNIMSQKWLSSLVLIINNTFIYALQHCRLLHKRLIRGVVCSLSSANYYHNWPFPMTTTEAAGYKIPSPLIHCFMWQLAI